MKSYYWVHWELLLAGRGKRDHQNFRQKFSPKIIHLKTIFSIFLEQLSFSTSGCEELLLGPLGAAAGRKREEDHQNFRQKFTQNIMHLKTIVFIFWNNLVSRPPVVKSYYWVHWELLLVGRGKRDHQNFRQKFSPKIIHLKTIFQFFGTT